MTPIRQHEANFLRSKKQEIIVHNHKSYLVEKGTALLLLNEYRDSIKVK